MEISTGCVWVTRHDDWLTDVTPPQWPCYKTPSKTPSKASHKTPSKAPPKTLRHLRLYKPVLILLFSTSTSSSTTTTSSPFALVSTFLRVLVFCCDLTTSCAVLFLTTTLSSCVLRRFVDLFVVCSGFSFDVLSTDLLLYRLVCCRSLRRNVVVTRDDVPVWPYPENFCVHSSSVEDDVVFLFTSLMLVSQYTATTEVGVSLLFYADTIDS